MSFRKLLSDNMPTVELSLSHATAQDMKEYCYANDGKFFWNTAFKFSFVRNPFDWVVSLYEFINAYESHPNYKQVCDMDFEQFCQWNVDCISNKKANSNGSFHTLSEFLFDNKSGELLVDFYGRLENYEEDCHKIMQRLNIKTNDIPFINITENRNKDYRSYYTEKSKSIITDGFHNDLVNFNYKY